MFYFFVWLLALLGSTLSFPSSHLWLGSLAWFSFAPLFYFAQKLPWRKSWLINFLFFVALFLTLFWINPLVDVLRFRSFAIYPVLLWLLFILPLGYSLVITLATVISRPYPLFLKAFIYALFWAAFEYVLTFVPLVFPISFALALSGIPWFLQLTPIIGMYGIVFLLMAVNALLALAFYHRKMALFFLALFLFTANFTYGVLVLQSTKASPTVCKIGLVQPAMAWEKSLFAGHPFFLRLSFQKLLQFSQKFAPLNSPSLIVWPETALDCYLLQSHADWAEEISRTLKKPLLTGTLWYDHFTKKPANVAVLIDNEPSCRMSVYKKQKLFPFSETGSYKMGSESNPLILDREGLRALGSMLCYESLYPQVAAELTGNGAGALVLLSNDAWFGKTRWPYLHMYYMVFRALENGRSAIHLNNTGPSVVISPRGVCGTLLPYGKPTLAVAQVEIAQTETLYNRSQNLFAKIILILAAGLLLRPFLSLLPGRHK